MHDLRPFCRELKKMKFKVKLDTNGLNLKRIKELIAPADLFGHSAGEIRTVLK